MSGEGVGLESALENLDVEMAAYTQALNAAVKASKRARTASDRGLVRDIAAALENVETASSALVEAAMRLRKEWDFDAEPWFASGDYTRELLERAAAEGLTAFEADERILCYPTIVQVSPGDTSVLVDKKKERGVRPSAVVSVLRKLAEREPKSNPRAFIEALATAYDHVCAVKGARSGAPVKLIDVYAVLTIMPGAARDYTKPEFARDVYLLDQSGIVETKKGRTMSLPASAMTRSPGAVLRTVTRSGQAKDYAGISFEGGNQ
jgi:hypothetical protein